MTDAPIALTVHDGHSTLPIPQQQLVVGWLAAHGIDADQVSADHVITVLTVPYRPPADDGTPWLIQIIVFHQMYVGPDGARELDLLSRKPVAFQRTVPLTVPFPTAQATDAGDRRQDDGRAP